ncbi:NAD(P)-dependent oxidoreductase [Candidatus Pacearchaeota archaeon]|nr:NAD(P)-dependent oxidoreductase [Candidatus Pacearchaeota archaeon]
MAKSYEFKEVKRDKGNILITGGAGYLGSVMTGHFLESGYNVTCLDNLSFSQKSLMIYAHNPKFDFIYGDVRDQGLVKRVIKDKDVIIPLAARVGMPLCDRNPQDAREINEEAVDNLNYFRSPEQKILYPNTNSGYGARTGEVFCTEDTPLQPISLYGKTKCKAEKDLLEGTKDALTFRLATVFGVSPRMRTDLLVNDFVLKAVQDRSLVLFESSFKRNYIHIRDVARAFEHGIENYETMKNKPYNLGLDDANLSKLELAQKIKKYVPGLEILEAPIGKDPDKRNYIVSNKRLLDTGFKPAYSLDDGIVELLKAYEILLKNNLYGNV